MHLGILFPSEKSFYIGMGVEIYYNFPEIRKIYKEAEKITGIKFKDGLIYEQDIIEWNEQNRRIAVLLTSIAHFEVFKATYKIEPEAFLGDELGFLSACVCAKSITVQDAIKILCTEDWKYSLLKYKRKNGVYNVLGAMSDCIFGNPDANKLIKYAVDAEIECIIEIGPDSLLTKSINAVDCKNKPITVYFDTSIDREFILENLEYKKYFNNRYILRRMIGIAAATQNYNESTENDEMINRAYSALKSYVDEIRTKEQRGGSTNITDYDIELCIKELNLIFKYKKVPIPEIQERIILLQNETAIDFKSYFSEWFN